MKDLTQGSIPRHLAPLALPMAAGMLLQTLYLFVDLYFVASLASISVNAVIVSRVARMPALVRATLGMVLVLVLTGCAVLFGQRLVGQWLHDAARHDVSAAPREVRTPGIHQRGPTLADRPVFRTSRVLAGIGVPHNQRPADHRAES